MLRFIFVTALFLAVTSHSSFAEMKCGAQSCGGSTKTQKTIEGVVYNCDVKKCSTPCCTLGDPPVCSVKTETINDCTPARAMPGKKLQGLTAPRATKLKP